MTTYSSLKLGGILEDSFANEVKYIWETSSKDLLQKLDNFKKGLERWAGQIQINRKRRKEFLTEKISELLGAERDDNNLAEMINAKIQLNFEVEKDECYLGQRAQLNWLKFGDRNTTFFYSQATQHRRKKFIHKLQNEDGRETEVLQEIEGVARSYFQILFSAGERGNYEYFLSGIDRCVSEEDN